MPCGNAINVINRVVVRHHEVVSSLSYVWRFLSQLLRHHYYEIAIGHRRRRPFHLLLSSGADGSLALISAWVSDASATAPSVAATAVAKA